MNIAVPPLLGQSSKPRVVLRLVAWAVVWLAGVMLTGFSVIEIMASSHRWDARVSVPVHGQSSIETARFRPFNGGAVNVFATSLVHGHAGSTPFRGTIAIRVKESDGTLIRNYRLGRRGVPHVQRTDSSWTTVDQVMAPSLWLGTWRLEARLDSPDPAFPAAYIDVLLRKERRDLGMGGMVYHVTIFIGLFLIGIALALALAWRWLIGNAPFIVSALAIVATALLLGTG